MAMANSYFENADGPAGSLRARLAAHPLSLRLLIVFLFVFLVSCVVSRPMRTQETTSSSVGIKIAPQFRAYYEDNGGLQFFGYPLASTYEEPGSSRLVQYYQRMRLEYDLAGEEMHVTPLGEYFVPSPSNQMLAPVPEDDPGLSFPGTDLTVQGEFRNFYEAHGGEKQFGRPITPQLDEGGTWVQYFQNARLEWHPESPLDYRVQLGMLGESHYRLEGFKQDPTNGRPLDSAGVKEAVIRANFRAPILYEGDEQVIFVDVETPDGTRPVSKVQVRLEATFDGQTVSKILRETDGEGHTQADLDFVDATPGQRVQIKLVAISSDGETIGTTTHSFKTWW